MEETFEPEELRAPKKRRGRPRKANTILLPAEMSALGVLHTAQLRRKSRKPRVTSTEASPSCDAKPSMVGQAIHGVVDGSFDAGFLVSLRVGESDNVYRGVVFGPGLSIPISKDVDVATKVKITRRSDDPPAPNPPSLPSPTLRPAEDTSQGAEVNVSIPPAFNGYGVTDTRQQPQQEFVSPFWQSAFVHSAASFQSTAQGFPSRGLGNPYHFVSTEFGYGCSPFDAGGPAVSRGPA